MKIAMLGHKRIPSREGGVEVVVEELSTRMVNRGHDVVCYNRGGKHVAGSKFSEESKREYKGVKLKKVITIDKKGLAAMTSSFFATVKALFSKAKVIHYHAEGPCAMMWIIKWFSNKKVIVTIHGLDWQRAKWGGLATKYIKFGEKMAVKYADEIIVLSANVKKYFKDTYNRETIFIPNGISKPAIKSAKFITEKYNLKKDDYILYLGRIVPEKGVHYLLEAFSKIKTDKKLVIAGGSSDTASYYSVIKELAKKDDRVILTGFVQGEELYELFSNAYVYCLPSDLEGMPLSLLEAMSYGNCCLTSNIDECSEVIEDKGITFEKSNVDDLEEKLNDLIKNKNKVREYKKNAQEFILNKYNWDDVTDETLNLYNNKINDYSRFSLNNKKLYYIFFVSSLLYWLLEASLVNSGLNLSFSKILPIVGILSFSIMWINTVFTKKEYITQFIMLFVLVFVYFKSGMQNNGLLLFFPAIVGLKNIKIYDVVNIMFKTLLIFSLVFSLLCVFQIVPVVQFTKQEALFGIKFNMLKLANQHGNTIFVIFFNLIASYTYVNYKKNNLKRCVFLQVLVIIIYHILQSRTGLLMCTSVIWGSYIIKKINIKKNKPFLFIERNFVSLFYLVVFFIGNYLKNTFIYSFLNKLISARIEEVSHYLENVGMLPKSIQYDWICDNTQVKIMASYGIIFTIIYCLIYYKCIKKLQQKNKNIEIFFIIIYLLYSYAEVSFVKPVSDFSMLFLVYAFNSMRCKDEENC